MKKSFIAPYDIYEAISGRDRAVLLPGAVARSDVPPPHMQMVAGSILVSGKILSTWWVIVPGGWLSFWRVTS